MIEQQFHLSLAQLNPILGDVKGNLAKAQECYLEAGEVKSDILLFPELFLSGYPPEDLVLRSAFIEDCHKAIDNLVAFTKTHQGPAIIIGTPWRDEEGLFNAVIVIDKGVILGVSKKVDLPNYGVFDEKRVFDIPAHPGPINIRGLRVGIPICQDIWGEDITECLAETGAEILLVPNGSPFQKGKRDIRLNIAVQRVQETHLPLIYLNMIGGQDEILFDGGSFILNGDLSLTHQLPQFEEQLVHTHWQKGESGEWHAIKGDVATELNSLEEIYHALMLGLKDYVRKNHFQHVVLGLSGGVDSALCAAIAVDALGADKVHCVMLPYHYTAQESLDDAADIAKRLDVRYDIISIKEPVLAFQHNLSPLFQDMPSDITEENMQSRARGLILMAISNKKGGLLLTTGNKSEVAVGYATLYGDMNGGFNPIKDIYKTEVYALCHWRNQHFHASFKGKKGEIIPPNIIIKAPTAELREGQCDQDSLPPYDMLDDILKRLIEEKQSMKTIIAAGHDAHIVETIQHLVYISEYKRRQSALGIKISPVNFGKDRRYPITNQWRDKG